MTVCEFIKIQLFLHRDYFYFFFIYFFVIKFLFFLIFKIIITSQSHHVA